MVAEIERIQHVDHVVRSVGVFLAQFVQQPDLDEGLMMEALLVADDLDGDVRVGFVVECSDHLAEAAFADDLENLVAIGYVVVGNLGMEMVNCSYYVCAIVLNIYLIVTAIVIVVATIQCGTTWLCVNLA